MPLRLLILGLSLLILVSACDAGADVSSVSTPEATPYALDLEAVSSQLQQLDSYRAEYHIDFDGTRGGQAVSGQINSTVEINNEDDAAHSRMDISGANAGFDDKRSIAEFYRIDNKVYLKGLADWTWFEQLAGTTIQPEDVGFFDLNTLLVMPNTASVSPESDTSKGNNLTVLSFTEQALSDPNIIFKHAEGTLWLDDEKRVHKYQLKAAGRFVTPIPHAHILDEGTLDISYELVRLNDPSIKITPPKNSKPNLLASLPRPNDAELTAVYPALLEYTSVVSPVSATLFYKHELSTLGWTPVLTDVFEEKARLAFSKDDKTTNIIINPAQEEKVKVVLSLDQKNVN
ncbi:MAG: hypothetical protein KDJ52_26180 [Anaerolineae bacterium]|nr:hypothetical protein [Anaerolineae bacterium]